MVDSNVALASGDEVLVAKLPESARITHISQKAAAENVAYLRTLVESWLAVLFNVFSSAGRDSQAPVGDVISTWVAIADEKVCLFYRLSAQSLIGRNYRTSQRRTTSSSRSSSRISVPRQQRLKLLVVRRTQTTSWR